ncbi:helix-turn-helix domain-containing protein [Chryseobacterium gossypii]|uniref:helix-turn-helix domain-containing protein n=1 Tax=Chryseobacterium gossypii TaxID=3231602 RepID=UPI0035263F5B
MHISEKEKQKIISVFEDIRLELDSLIDDISQDLVISYIEVLLNYCNRYYKRQFITRKPASHTVLEKFENYLSEYFDNELSLNRGLPDVKYFSDKLHLSSSYLSDMLRNLTGLNTQQHIHAKLIDKAKAKLASTDLSIAEIAYTLGFEHPQSFNKLFKAKTRMSPLQFRQSLS